MTVESSLARWVFDLQGTKREEALVAHICAVVADLRGVDPGSVVAAKPWRNLQVSGEVAAALLDRLSEAVGTGLPVTLLFDHPTPLALADHLLHLATGEARDHHGIPEAGGPLDDPVVIVGMACRFPGGVTSPEQLWDLVAAGRDAIAPFPGDRGWDVDAIYDPRLGSAGKSCTRHGGFLDAATDFDAAFFGVSPREALAMDPQQRVLLEMSWEALENADIVPARLHGSRTGVFVGCYNQEYGPKLGEGGDEIEGYRVAGSYTSVASGRIAYSHGFEGPAITVDTACSSSLVALHLAERSLRQGECSLALAGGVMVMATPGPYIEFSRQRGLSPDGRCRAFSSSADGTGWSEGAGLLVLERLSDAVRNGHRVQAVVRGTAVNQDGASNGLTAPSGVAQQRVIRQALANAGLGPSDVDVVEAHGTGTRLGDPIEAHALLATYGQGRPADRPVWLGSLKSNIGHAQAAAGVGGVIKMVMAMRHGVMPRTLHADEPSSYVDWDSGAVSLLTGARAWDVVGDRPRRAAVSSFGISGTNAHVILEEPPPAPEVGSDPGPRAAPLVLSARSAASLRGAAERLPDFLRHTPVDDLAWSLVSSRSLLDHRAVVIGDDAEDLARGLGVLASGAGDRRVVRGAARPVGRTVFVFPGQGSQWVGMGAALWETSPVFAERLAECDTALAPHLGWSVIDVVRGLREEPWAEDEAVLQPVLFAVMVSLAELWRSHGVEPDVVVGHSQGEIAAACVAGGLSLEDGARVVALRSKVIAARLTGLGGMIAVRAAEERVRAMLETVRGRVDIGSLNGPSWCVVSGDEAGLAEVVALCAENDLRTRRVPITYPSHSSIVEAVREELIDVLRDVRPRSGHVEFFSTVEGRRVDTSGLDAEYWYRNLRQPVRLGQAIRELVAGGCGAFVEVSAHPVLAVGIHETVEAEEAAGRCAVVGTLRRDHGDLAEFWTAAAQLHVRGHDVDWTGAFAGRHPCRADLPGYRFDRTRFWAADNRTTATAPCQSNLGHPVLTSAVAMADGGVVCTGRLSLATHPWLADHVVFGEVVVPGAALLDLVLCAAEQAGADGVEDFVLEQPLVLAPEGGTDVQVVVEADGEKRSVVLHSRHDDVWLRHGGAVLADVVATAARADRVAPSDVLVPVDLDGVYDVLRERGLDYGPAFTALRAMWRVGGEVHADVVLPDHAPHGEFLLHPVVLDAALHAVLVDIADSGDDRAHLPFGFGAVTLGPGVVGRTAHVRFSREAHGGIALAVTGESDAVAMSISSLVMRPATAEQLKTNGPGLTGVVWERADPVEDRPSSFPPVTCLVAGTPADEDVVSATHGELARVVGLLQEHIGAAARSRLVVVTRGAAGIGGPTDPIASAVWGLVRSAQVEHPDVVTLLDVEDEVPETLIRRAAGSGEPQLAVRGGELVVPRLRRWTGDSGPGPRWGGTWLLTGGTGTLAGVVARRLAARGARRLVLVSRRGEDAPGAGDLATELRVLGAEVDVVACDVADRAAVRELVDALGGTLRGVVHAAGLLDDGVVMSLSADRLGHVLRAKVDGAWNLHLATSHLDLDHFVLFSSVTGVLGAAGQANYAAGNAFLDGLAGLRRSAGLAATSIAWGLWARASGLTGHLGATEIDRMARYGVGALTDEEGVRLLEAACATGQATVVAARFDLATLRATRTDVAPVLRGLVRTRPRRQTVAAETDWLERTVALDGDQCLLAVRELVFANVATVLGYSPGTRVDDERAFKDTGFDSLSAMELRNRLSAGTGLRLPSTLVFDHPTPAAVVARLVDELEARRDDSADLVRRIAELRVRFDRLADASPARVAVVGELTAFLAAAGASASPRVEPAGDLAEATDEDLMALIDAQG